jgi:transcriptional regulator with XRE-family HTH domain
MSRRNGSAGAAETTGAVFGQVLKHCRERAGLTQAELARFVLCDRSVVTKVEAGSHVPRSDFAHSCDAVLKTAGLLGTLWEKINWYPPTAEHPDWFRKRAAMEELAVSIRQYQSGLIPGLLQTADYAGALFAQVTTDETSIKERVSARLGRQIRFMEPEGPVLVVILEESALRREVGGPDVMRDQLGHLLSVGELPNVRIQVAPFTGRLVTPKVPMSLIVLPDGGRWVYSESLDRGHLSDSPTVVARHERTYDLLQADSLGARDSASLISQLWKCGGDDQPRTQSGDLAQEQPQRERRRRLHRGGPRVSSGRRPRA